jgi:hypothetical protein
VIDAGAGCGYKSHGTSIQKRNRYGCDGTDYQCIDISDLRWIQFPCRKKTNLTQLRKRFLPIGYFLVDRDDHKSFKSCIVQAFSDKIKRLRFRVSRLAAGDKDNRKNHTRHIFQ